MAEIEDGYEQQQRRMRVPMLTTSSDQAVATAKQIQALDSPRSRLTIVAKALAGEALGTFLLVFTIAALTAVNEGTPGGIGLLSFAMAASFCVTVIILTIGHTSGAHINPSITVGFAAAGRFPWSQVPFYMVSQITGSVLAILAAKWVYSFPERDFAVTQPRSGPWQSLVLETAMSFVVMFLACILSNNTSQVVTFTRNLFHTSILLMLFISRATQLQWLSQPRSG
ncbi:probable aquaporin NIP5-1 [Selaginella moellendorffii]|uniref:probable aquaporin NIP5-1 n=1 Tax=Selaginella moellendorffii TaxID=88036 RepID=UPI000D1CF731|nr:probable aquaporin NIP5-1 [Selaginella moellendorffii]|eukprot:XP_024514867.1 probable aquaporin NIP5-1 [Selaginella moellendorffii]